MRVVWVHGATCSGCGHALTALEFGHNDTTPGLQEWPLPCTERLVRHELVHSPAGCRGRLILESPEYGEMNVALASQPRPPA